MKRLFDRRVLSLALPAVASAMVPLIHRAVDMFWVRDLGTTTTAALTVSTLTVWLQHALGMLIGVGLGALVARYAGAKRRDAAGYVASQGLRHAAWLGLAFGAAGWFLAPLVIAGATDKAAVAAQAVPYTRLVWCGSLLIMIPFAGDAIFRAHADTRTPLRLGLVGLSLNLVLDPLLIYGWGPIPALGLTGAGAATLIASGVATVLHLKTLRAHGHLHAERPSDAALRLKANTRLGMPGLLGIDRVLAVRILKVGIPVAASSLLFNAIYLWILRVAYWAGGDAAQAGLGVGHTGEGVAWIMGMGWSAAAAALVGRALGAGSPNQAARHVRVAAVQCMVLSGLWAVVLYVFADPLAAFFAEGADAQFHGAAYFRIVAICLIPQAADLVIGGGFGGAGNTLPPTVISIVFSLARVPLAWFVAIHLDYGVHGIFWVITLTALLRALVIIAWWKRGAWRTSNV